MNILKLQDDLKNFSQQQLVMEMQRPSGNVPQFLVLSELSRRKRMRAEQDRAEAADTPTVAQETVAAAGMPMGGVTQMARAMAPNTSMTENTGIAAMMPKQPTRMAEGGTPQYKNRYEQLMAYLFGRDDDEEKEKPREGTSLAEMINFGGDYEPVKKAEGGVVKMQRAGLAGGTISAIAHLKVNYPKLYEAYKDDPEELALVAAEKFEKDMETAEDAELTGLEQIETPRTNFQKIMDFASYSPLKARKNMEKIEKGAKERDLQARVDTANALRRRNQFYVGEDPIFNDGGYSEQLKGSVIPVPLADADPLKFTPPNNLGGPSVAMDRPLNTDNLSQLELGPVLPNVSSNRPPVQPDNLPVNTSPTFTSMLPNISQENVRLGGDARDKVIKDYLATSDSFVDALDEANQMGGDRNRAFELFNALTEMRADPTITDFKGPYDDAIFDVNKRAMDFIRSDTYQPPSEVYPFLLGGDPRAIAKFQGESPEEVQAISDLLAKQAAADEAAKEQGFFTEQDDAAQSVFDEAIAAQEAMVEAENEPKTASDKIIKAFQDEYRRIKNNKASKAFDAEDVAVGSEPPDFEKIAEETEKKQAKDRQEAIEASAQNILDQIQTSQAATQKQASAADMSLSEYIKGLDKDRESSKWLAVARMGAELMKPSATIGEGIGKAVSVGAKDLQEGKKAYNKNKLSILALQARIDAAKAKSGALTTNQRLTQGLKFQEEARKLKEAAMLSDPPNLDALGQAEAYERVAANLLGMPSMSGGTVKAPSAR
jgi:hypothetical protein